MKNKFLTLLLHEILGVCVSRWFWFYLFFFNGVLYGLRYFTNRPEQVFISTLNSVLYFHLVSLLIFATLTWQNSADFISLVLSQPVNRRSVFGARLTSFAFSVSLFTGLSLIAQMGSSLPLPQLMQILIAQVVIQWIALGLGFLIAVLVEDRLKAMALAAGVILLTCFALDAFSLWVMINYSTYPLEKTILALGLLNPLTLLKYQSLAEQNSSLWIGYAGLLLTRAWKDGLLQVWSMMALFLWTFVPVTLAWRSFQRKDL